MSMSSTRTRSPQTNLRSLRKLLSECMADPPPICAWIRTTRVELRDKARAEGGQEAASYFSQEKVAQRVGVSLKAYRAFESFREPNYERRLAIARALGLKESYFEADGDREDRMREIVREELAGIRDDVERIERLLRRRAGRSRAQTEMP